MKITTLDNAPKSPSGLDASKMYSSESLEVMHLHLTPGQQVPQHANPFNAVLCILDGKVMFESGKEAFELNKFDVAEVEAGIERGFRNESGNDVRILVLKKLL